MTLVLGDTTVTTKEVGQASLIDTQSLCRIKQQDMEHAVSYVILYLFGACICLSLVLVALNLCLPLSKELVEVMWPLLHGLKCNLCCDLSHIT